MKQSPTTVISRHLGWLALAPSVLLLGATLGYAQLPASTTDQGSPAPAAAAPAQSPTASNSTQVVNMDVFTVQATSGQSYGASNMQSATRLNTPIVNVPQTISVINSNLISDLDASTIDQAARYTPGVVQRQNSPDGLVIRGLSPTAFNHYEDGYYAPPVYIDMVDIDRIEIIKGPSASIAGASESTGFVDYITKKPQFTDQDSASLTMGSWSTLRGVVDLTGPVPGYDNMAYRVIATEENGQSYRDFDQYKKFSIYPSFLWKITPSTELFIKIDGIENSTPGGYGAVYLAPTYGSTATRIVVPANAKVQLNQWLPLYINTSWPGMTWQNDESAFFVGLTRRFGDTFTVRQSADYYDYTSNRFYNGVSNNLSYDANGNLDGTYQTERGIGSQWAWRFQGDAAFEQNWLSDMISARALLGYELARTRGASMTFLGSSSTTPIDLLQPDYSQDIEANMNMSVDSRTEGGAFGYFGNAQLGFFHDMVILTGGVRRDQNKASWTQNQINGAVSDTRTTPVISSPIAGVTVKPTSWVSVYAVYSNAGAAASTVSTYPGIPTTDPRQILLTINPDTVNKEFGAKFTFFDSKFALDVSHFDTTQTDVILPITDPSAPGGSQDYLTSGNNSRGVEVDWSGDLTKKLSIYGGYLNDKTAQPGSKPLGGGLELRGIPRDKVQTFVRYAIYQSRTGFFAVKAGVVHQTSVYGITGDYYTLPAATRYDAGVDIKRGNWSYSVGIVNVTNVIMPEYAINQGSNTVDDPRNYYFSASISF